VIDNIANVQRRRKGLNNVSDDDCGAAWDSKSARYNTYLYLLDCDHSGTLKRIYWVTACQN